MSKPDYRIDPDSQVPPARQLIEHVLDALASGRLAAGDKLPSVRAMAGAGPR
jgi:DNA-binding transcriptional regulator YhcF (GntR family)